MGFLCEFGQNPPTGSGDRVQTRLIFSLYSLVTLKIRSRSPKSNQTFKPSHVTIYEVWPESVIWFKDRMQTNFSVKI